MSNLLAGQDCRGLSMSPRSHILSRVAARHLRAITVGFDQSSIEALRKDFLTLLKNVDRVATFEDLVKFSTAVRTWREHYLQTMDSIHKGMTDTMWYAFTGGTKYDPHYDPQVRDWHKYWDTRLRAGYWPLYGVLGSVPYESLRSWMRKWDGRFTEDKARESILDKWQREKKKWSDRVKREARKAWPELDEYVKWVFQRRDSNPVREVQEVYQQTVSGFSVTFVGMDGDSDYNKTAREKLQVGLAHYRERAAKTLPLLLGSAKLPIFLMGDQGIDCGGKYERDHIVICPVSAPPKEYTHIIAHEMGHHLYRVYLSASDTDFWYHAIKQDYAEADLNEILQAWLPSEWYMDTVKRLAGTDSVLALQIDGLAVANDWGPRSDAEEHLQKWGPKVRVPMNPITGYATKNAEEAFCEAVGRLVAYGPRAVPPVILSWLQLILPREIKVASRVNLHRLRELVAKMERDE